ncbi:MAG TPA: rhomboid family intramembrane serine protease [Kiritimatiellia bacterium]
MLKIGDIDNELDARTFGDYLFVQGIENQVDPNSRGGWDVWIINEQQVAAGEALLAKFKANPADPAFTEKSVDAEKLRKEQEKKERDAVAVSMRRRWKILPRGMPSTLALVMILISCAVTVMMMSAGSMLEQLLAMTRYGFSDIGLVYNHSLPEIRHGEIWRLITPIFMHAFPFHILFNMMWMRDLGSAIERKEGMAYFAGLVVATAVVSNLGQFYVDGPNFGGMSGVNYALFGYAWMRSKFDPFSGYAMHRSTVGTMMAWYFICFTGMLGPVANAAHSFGLGMGIVWGFIHGSIRSK